MNVLITGATGNLGSTIAALLAEGGSQLGPVPRAFAPSSTECAGSRDFDVADREGVEAFFSCRRFDVVVHCAAMTDVDGCEARPAHAWAVNALGTYHVAAATHRSGARFVCLSTDFVFDGSGDRPLAESDPSFPRSVYGETKLAGERLALLAAPGSLVVRTAWLHGPAEGGFVGAVLSAAASRRRIEVVADQVGSPSNSVDVADALLRLVAAGAQGIVHCANGGFCSRYELACAIVEDAGLGASVVPVLTDAVPRPARRPAFAPLDVARCEEIVGRAMRPWRQALADTVASGVRRAEGELQLGIPEERMS